MCRDWRNYWTLAGLDGTLYVPYILVNHKSLHISPHGHNGIESLACWTEITTAICDRINVQRALHSWPLATLAQSRGIITAYGASSLPQHIPRAGLHLDLG